MLLGALRLYFSIVVIISVRALSKSGGWSNDATIEITVSPTSGYKRLAIVYINNDFGKDLSDYMVKLTGQGPPSIVLNEGYTPGTTDFRTLIEKIKSTQPDALFIAGYVEQGTLMRQSKEQGLAVQIFASPSFENQDILTQAGNAAEGVIFPSYFDLNSDVTAMREFLTKYKDRYGEPAEGFGASSYAGIKTLFDAIERSQASDSERIRQSLNAMGNFQSVFGATHIDETGDLRYPIFLKAVANGEFVRKLDAKTATHGSSAHLVQGLANAS